MNITTRLATFQGGPLHGYTRSIPSTQQAVVHTEPTAPHVMTQPCDTEPVQAIYQTEGLVDAYGRMMFFLVNVGRPE